MIPSLLAMLLQLMLLVTPAIAASINATNAATTSSGSCCPEGFEMIDFGSVFGAVRIKECYSLCPADYDRFGFALCRKKGSTSKFVSRHKTKKIC